MASAVVALIGSATPRRPATLPSTRDEHDRLPIGAECFRARSERAGIDSELGEERRVPERHRAPLDPALHALARDGANDSAAAESTSPLLGAAHDGRGQRVLASPLEARRPSKERLCVDPLGRLDGDELRLAFGEGPGLVDHQRIDRRITSMASASLKSTPEVGASPCRDHDRHRRCEAERARTGDDEDGDRIDQRMSQARLGSDHRPHHERHHGARMTAGTK